MTFEIGLLLLLTVAAVVLFSIEKVSPDVTALTLVLALVFTGLLKSDTAFQGFGSETVIMILGLLILTAALMRTGVVDLVGGKILKFTGKSPMRILIVVMIASATLGAFMSNTASTAFFVPVVIGLAKKANMSSRQLLLPLAFSSILSSSVTLISTSTNIVVSGLMTRYDLKPIGMFELAPVGVPIVIAGLIYMTIVGKLFLVGPKGETTTAESGLRAYLSEVVVLPESPLVGKTLAEAKLGEDLDLVVVRISRDKKESLAPRADTVIRAGDVLLVEANPEDLLKVKDTTGIEIKADLKHGDPSLPSDDLGIVEVIILARSPLIGRTLKRTGFRERYGLQVLGISRHGQILHKKISEMSLRIGDILLIQGPRAEIATLEDDRTFRVIQTLDDRKPHRRRAPMAMAIFVGVLLLATFKILPFSVAVILGAVVAFFTKCITPEEAYRELEWKAVILIGSMLALGAAMEQTGTAKYLASLIVDWSSNLEPHLAARRLLRPHRLAHAADVEPGRRRCHYSDCHPNGAETRTEPPHLRHDGRRRRELLLSHAARALVPDGLRAGPLQILGLPQVWRRAHAHHRRHRALHGAARLAAALIFLPLVILIVTRNRNLRPT